MHIWHVAVALPNIVQFRKAISTACLQGDQNSIWLFATFYERKFDMVRWLCFPVICFAVSVGADSVLVSVMTVTIVNGIQVEFWLMLLGYIFTPESNLFACHQSKIILGPYQEQGHGNSVDQWWIRCVFPTSCPSVSWDSCPEHLCSVDGWTIPFSARYFPFSSVLNPRESPTIHSAESWIIVCLIRESLCCKCSV